MKKSQGRKVVKTKTPFEVEDLRTRLAIGKNYNGFKKTYFAKYPEIKAKNTDRFWSYKFKTSEKLEDQDAMTRDKINYIISNLPKGQSKILDLGIGQGYLEQGLRQLGIAHKLYGIDISKKSIDRARKSFEGQFIESDVMKTDKLFNKSFFDVIVAIELIEHVQPTKIFDLYKKVKKLLRKDGIFIISTPLNEGLRYTNTNPSAHVREYTIPILTAEFKISGFKIMKLKTFFAFQNFYILKRLIAKILDKWKPNNVVIVAKNRLS